MQCRQNVVLLVMDKTYTVKRNFKVELEDGSTVTLGADDKVVLEYTTDKATFGFRLADGRLASYEECQYWVDEANDDIEDEYEREAADDRSWDRVNKHIETLIAEVT